MTEAPALSDPKDGARLSRRGVERLDLLLLTIEPIVSAAVAWASPLDDVGFMLISMLLGLCDATAAV